MKYQSFATAVVLVLGVLGAQAQTPGGADKKRFFELSYGYSPAGDVNTKPFTAASANDSTANAQYGASQSYSLNYGWRQPYGWPVDVSLWISQMQTPFNGVVATTPFGAQSRPLSKRTLQNTYAVALDRDVWRNADWVMQVGGMLGQMDLIDAGTKGSTWGLSAGVRYQPQTAWFASAKLRYVTVPESKINDFAAIIGILDVPSTNMPTLHLGWGWSY
jgi:hypothetical protein